MQTENRLALISIPIVLVMSFVGSFLPPFIDRKWKSQKLLEKSGFILLSGFAGGILLTVGYVHSFSDASQSFGYLVYNGVIPNYAWAGLFALIGSLSTFFIELFSDIILSFLRQSYTKSLLSLNSTSIEKPPIDQQNSEFIIEHSHTLQYSEGESNVIFVVEMGILLIGLSFHSFFVGLSLGVTPDDTSLFFAIIAHQFFEALALGETIARAQLSSTFVFLIDIIFSLSTPLGIVFGLYLLNQITNYNTYYLTDGVCNAFSAGILIYVGSIHLIFEQYHRIKNREKNKEEKKKLFIMFVGILIGSLFMSIIGIWA